RSRFRKDIGASILRSEALPCLKEDETTSEERLGRAKAKPPIPPIPEATLSRGSPVSQAFNPMGNPAGRFRLRTIFGGTLR
ncbi:hypothetical protein, partial [Shinella sp. M31]|uniref:hypothetical protein n=1 Tax=Shinella sp. M31 TaxID=3368615 RepID=UPI003BA0A370